MGVGRAGEEGDQDGAFGGAVPMRPRERVEMVTSSYQPSVKKVKMNSRDVARWLMGKCYWSWAARLDTKAVDKELSGQSRWFPSFGVAQWLSRSVAVWLTLGI